MMEVNGEFQALIREIGLDENGVFSDERIVPWRKLADRQNCTLDAKLHDGGSVRLHVKRYAAVRSITPAQREFEGHRLLVDSGIPTAPLVAFGILPDGRSFTIFANLNGFTPADKLIEGGTAFEDLLNPTADLAANLHKHRLGHQDLYLCHFMVRSGSAEVRLIDTARVGPLGNSLIRQRRMVKDLAQFWYSTTKLAITDEQRLRWLNRYSQARGIPDEISSSRVMRKVQAIARHDERLKLKQPGRNISIPT